MSSKKSRLGPALATFALCLFLAPAAGICADGYRNYEPETPLAPGQSVALPDGSRTTIEEKLPDGNFRTPEGFVISPSGVLQNGPDQGATITVTPNISGAENAINIVLPGQSAATPGGAAPGTASAPGVAIAPAPDGTGGGKGGPPPAAPGDEGKGSGESAKNPGSLLVFEDPGKSKPGNTPNQKGTVKPEKAGSPPDKGKTDEKPDLTLAQMLPLTPADGSAPKKGKSDEKPAAPKKEDVKTPKAGAAKPAEPAKPRAEKPKAEARPAPGQPMRIPESALKTGNLDFLEGCWEGTRPEYTSKRTIKECFCFGKGGKTGKRRIYDRTYGRTCVGATRAKLSKNGVLSVTSASMPCSDGEKWGAAEMVCRNSGPRTPCSWVFTDAGNGKQAYEIPFLRVRSCGR